MRMMKTLLVICFVLMVTGMMVDAKAYITGINWDTTCDLPYPKTANDYHVKGKVWSANNIIPQKIEHAGFDKTGITTWALTGFSVNMSATEPDVYDFTMDYKITKGEDVFNTAPLHFGIKFSTEDYNRIEITEAYWTHDGENVGPSNVTGYHIWDDSLLGLQIEVHNNTTATMDIHDMQLTVTRTEIPLGAMSRSEMGLPGTSGTSKYSTLKWINYNEKIHIEPKSSAVLNLSKIAVRPNEGEFLLLRFTEYNSGNATWIQHQHKIGFGK